MDTPNTTVDLFEICIRRKYRFPSPQGIVDAEDLFSVGLESLNDTAKTLHKQLSDSTELNFIDADKQPNVELTQKLDIVKRIIKIRLDEKRAAEEAMQLKQKEKQLLELLHSKQQAKLGELTEDEIKQQLEEIQAGVTA